MRTRVARRAIATALLAIANPAIADETAPLRLEWTAPAECPTKAQVLAGVERILGGGGAGGARQPVSARAIVSRSGPSRWRVKLTTRAGASTGERTVDADSCNALADAAALIFALAVNPESRPASPPPLPLVPPLSPHPAPPVVTPDPGAATPLSPSVSSPVSPGALPSSASPTLPPLAATVAPAAPEKGPASQPPASGQPPLPTTAAVNTPPPRSAADPKLRGPHRVALGLSGVTALGPLPNLGAGGEATIAYRPWRLRFEAGGAYWAPQTETPSGQVSASADFSLVSIVGRVGYTVSLGAFELVPSLMAEADFMEAEAKGGVTTSIPASATWFALGGGGWVFWALTREIALRLGVEAALPFTRPYFEVTHGPEVFKPGVISAKGAIGLELRFL